MNDGTDLPRRDLTRCFPIRNELTERLHALGLFPTIHHSDRGGDVRICDASGRTLAVGKGCFASTALEAAVAALPPHHLNPQPS